MVLVLGWVVYEICGWYLWRSVVLFLLVFFVVCVLFVEVLVYVVIE